MLLTKERALELHRSMWLWISREIAKSKSILIIDMAKEEYIEKYCNNAPIDHYCFACEYAYRKAKEKYDDKYYIAALRCEFCPLNWGTSGDEEGCYMCECNDFDYESGLYAQCRNMRGSSKDSWKKQAKLAYKIAMLPESEKE